MLGVGSLVLGQKLTKERKPKIQDQTPPCLICSERVHVLDPARVSRYDWSKECGFLIVTVLMKNWEVHRISVYILSMLGAVFLFIGGPDYYAPRIYRLAWDLGHICLFFLWTYALMRTWKGFAMKPFHIQFILISLITLFLGFSVEFAQSAFDRTFSIQDVLRNMIGSTAAIAFLSPTRNAISKRLLHTTQVLVSLLLLVLIYPFMRVLVDEVIARGQLPVLSNFETPFEIHRWRSRSIIAIDQETVKEGRTSLKVLLTTDRYSGASLVHFPSDWRNYKYLHMSIFNTSPEPLELTLRIHDDQHVRNAQSYWDRFNTTFILYHGWNDIDVSIEDIKNAPKNRIMDLRTVKDVTIFTVSLKTPKVIYVDDVRLVN